MDGHCRKDAVAGSGGARPRMHSSARAMGRAAARTGARESLGRKDGGEDLKILPKCNLPLTGVGVVDLIITDLGVLEVTGNGLALRELAPGVTRDEISAKTGCPVDVSALAARTN